MKKRILGILCSLLLILVLFTSCKKPELVSVEAEFPNNTYQIGSGFLDVTGARLKLVYSDHEEYVDIELGMIDTYDIINMYAYGTTGEKKLTVRYVDEKGNVKSTTVTVNVEESKYVKNAKAKFDEIVGAKIYDAPEASEVALAKQLCYAALSSASTQEEADAILNNAVAYLGTVLTKADKENLLAQEKQIADKVAKVDKIIEDVAKINATLANFGLTDTIDPNSAVGKALAAIEKNIDDVEALLGNISKNDPTVADQLAQIDTKLTAINKQLDVADTTSLAGRVAALEQYNLNEIKTAIDNLNATIDNKIATYIATPEFKATINSLLDKEALKAEILASVGATLPKVELKVVSGAIKWKYTNEDDTKWQELATLASLTGPAGADGAAGKDGTDGTDGKDGKTVEMQYNPTTKYIEYKYTDETTWHNLVPVVSGTTGEDGPAGADGKSVLVRYENGKIYSMYTGDAAWTELIDFDAQVAAQVAANTNVAWMLEQLTNDSDPTTIVSMVKELSLLTPRVDTLETDLNALLNYLNNVLGLDTSSSEKLSDYLAVELPTLLNKIIEEYLGEDYSLSTLRQKYLAVVEFRNATTEKVKNINAILASNASTSDKINDVLASMVDVNDLLRLLDFNEAQIYEINQAFNSLVAGATLEFKNNIIEIIELSSMKEFYDKDALLAKYGVEIGSYTSLVPEYKAYDKVLLYKNQIIELIKNSTLATFSADVKKFAELFAQLQLIDTFNEVLAATFATELEKQYQTYSDPSYVLYTFYSASTVKDMHETKEVYKNRLLTTRSLFTAIELYEEASKKINPVDAFIKALKAILPITFESVRNDLDNDLYDQIVAAITYLNEVHDLFDPATIDPLLEAYPELQTIKALGADRDDLITTLNDIIALYNTYYTQINTPYNINYNLNGGTNHPENPTTYLVRSQVAFREPTRVGYTFAGWYSSSSFTGTPVTQTPDTVYATGYAVYAKWNAKSYKLTFDSCSDILNFDFDSTITGLPTAITPPSGYVFAGWKIDDVLVVEGTSTWTYASDKEAKAFFTKETFTLEFKVDGAVYSTTNYEFDQAVTAPANPTKTGYTFTGWDKAVPEKMPAQHLTINAKFDINSYDLTVKAEGYLDQVVSVEFNKSLTTVAEVVATYVKAGYSFLGWDKDGDNITDFTNISTTELMPANNLTINAVFGINQYTITYKIEGMPDEVVTYNFDAVISTHGVPLKTGYTFDVWEPAVPQKMPAENLVVTATFNINQYTYTFYSKDEASVLSTATVDYATGLTVPSVPSVEGYTFTNWKVTNLSDSAAPTSTVVPTSVPAYNIKVVAEYTINQYTLVVKANEADTPIDTTSTVDYNADITSKVPSASSPLLTATGYSFLGWDTDGDGVMDLNTSPIVMPANNLTLVAIYSTNPYSIIYNIDGVESTKTYDFADSITLNADPTKTGWVFTGWTFESYTTDVNTKTNIGAFPASGKMPAYNLYITANFTANVYTVTYDNNVAEANNLYADAHLYMSGTMATSTFTYDYAADDKKLTAFAFSCINSAVMPKFALRFTGWNTAADGSGTSYADEAIVKKGQDLTTTLAVTLYAQWEPAVSKLFLHLTNDLQYVVSNLEYGKDVSFWAQEIVNPTTKVLPTPLPAFIPVGTAFVGWRIYQIDPVTKVKTTIVDIVRDETNKPLGELVWTFLEDQHAEAILSGFNFEVAFNGNGSDAGTMANQAYVYQSGDLLNANTYTRTGYVFKGWALEANGSVKYADNVEFVETPTAKGQVITLYAQWEAIEFKVAFNGNTATEGVAPATIDFVYDAQQPLPANPFTKTGYTFAGWNTATDGTGTTYADEAIVKNLTTVNDATVTLYAQWTANTYTITYDVNGGDTLTPATQTVTYDAAYTLVTPTRTGYTFVKWTKADAEFTSGTWALTTDITLVAQWTANTYTLTFNNGLSTTWTVTYDAPIGDFVVSYTPPLHNIHEGWKIGTEKFTSATIWKYTANQTAEPILVDKEYNFVIDWNNPLADTGRTTLTVPTKHGETIQEAMTRNGLTATAYYGHQLIEFNTKEDKTGTAFVLTTAYDGVANPDGRVIYAIWKPATYTVELTSEIEGQPSAHYVFTLEVTYGQNVATGFGDLYYPGYTFKGWYITVNGVDTKLVDGVMWVWENEPIHAEWEIIQ